MAAMTVEECKAAITKELAGLPDWIVWKFVDCTDAEITGHTKFWVQFHYRGFECLLGRAVPIYDRYLVDDDWRTIAIILDDAKYCLFRGRPAPLQ